MSMGRLHSWMACLVASEKGPAWIRSYLCARGEGLAAACGNWDCIEITGNSASDNSGSCAILRSGIGSKIACLKYCMFCVLLATFLIWSMTRWNITLAWLGVATVLGSPFLSSVPNHFNISSLEPRAAWMRAGWKLFPQKSRMFLSVNSSLLIWIESKWPVRPANFKTSLVVNVRNGIFTLLLQNIGRSFMTMESRSLLPTPFLYILVRNSFQSANHKGGRQRVKSIAGSLAFCFRLARVANFLSPPQKE